MLTQAAVESAHLRLQGFGGTVAKLPGSAQRGNSLSTLTSLSFQHNDRTHTLENISTAVHDRTHDHSGKMFASRANQENAIYAQQTAAAAKPLNQGVKGVAPKTPGNKAPKTPFKVLLNDENTLLGAGKTGGKGKQAALFGEGKSGKVESSAFVTPAGTWNATQIH